MKQLTVITITCNRLELTKQYLGQLRLKGGYPFKHIIVDNGSTDGTLEWLRDVYKPDAILSLEKNYGIVDAWKIGMKFAIKHFNPDFIIKFDNDCEVHTDKILVHLLDWYNRGCDNFVIAPLDVIIPDNYMPRELHSGVERDINVRYVSHTGGMFQMLPIKVAKMLLNCKDDNLIGGDLLRGHFFINKGITVIYLTDLKISHRGIDKQTLNYKLK